MIFSTSGSIIKSSEGISHIRERTHTILLRTSEKDAEEVATVMNNIIKRDDRATRIVGMNGGPDGESPESKDLEEELWKRITLYRKYADHIFVHPFTEDKSIRINALREFIIQKGLTRSL